MLLSKEPPQRAAYIIVAIYLKVQSEKSRSSLTEAHNSFTRGMILEAAAPYATSCLLLSSLSFGVISSDNTLGDTVKSIYVQTNGRRFCKARTRELEEQVMGPG